MSTSHSWWDDEDPYEDGEYIPVRVFWNAENQAWECRCAMFTYSRRCVHLVRWRRTVDVNPLPRYL